MAKKNKKYGKKATPRQRQARILGGSAGKSNGTVIRLPTTVQAAVTEALSPSEKHRIIPFTETVRQDRGNRFITRLSNMAGRFSPGKQQPGFPGANAKAGTVAVGNARLPNDKLKKLARKATRKQRRSRSRLPLVALLVLALVGGGFFAYKTFGMPDFNLAGVFDFQSWKNKATSLFQSDDETKGKKPKTLTADNSRSKHVLIKKGKSPKASGKNSYRTTSGAKKKSPSKAKAHKPTRKSFSNLSKAQKQKIWQKRLAEARKKAAGKYGKSNSRTRR